jgi:tetratricopeptide (TPR) repeat protein
LSLIEQVPEGPYRNLGGVCRGLADVAFAQNKPAEAAALAQRALESDRQRDGDGQGTVGADLGRLARAARLRGQDADAEKLLKQALDCVGGRGLTRPEMRRIYDDYEALLQKLGRTDEARKLEARAVELKLPPPWR